MKSDKEQATIKEELSSLPGYLNEYKAKVLSEVREVVGEQKAKIKAQERELFWLKVGIGVGGVTILMLFGVLLIR